MRLRTFNAATLDEAMALVRDELGDDAVIVSTYQSRRGRGAQVTAALDDTPGDADFAAEVAHEEIGVEPDDEIAQVLAFHRIDGAIRSALARDARACRQDDAALALATAIDAATAFAALPSRSDTPVMFVGPPGAGKTVTVVKLAARAVLAGMQVHILTTDSVRSGAYEQLAALADMMDVPLTATDTPAALAEALAAIDDADLVLIDTPGTNPFSPAEMADLAAFAETANAEQVLVLSAGGDGADQIETAAIFARAGVRLLHATRLDCARRFGGIVAAAIAAHMTIAEASATPFVANGLSPLSAASLARLLTETAFKVGELQRRGAAS
jgi:flagellar biosynthesis protein FlhF